MVFNIFPRMYRSLHCKLNLVQYREYGDGLLLNLSNFLNRRKDVSGVYFFFSFKQIVLQEMLNSAWLV